MAEGNNIRGGKKLGRKRNSSGKKQLKLQGLDSKQKTKELKKKTRRNKQPACARNKHKTGIRTRRPEVGFLLGGSWGKSHREDHYQLPEQ